MERFFGRKITSKFNLEEKAKEEKAKEVKPSEPEKKNKTSSIIDIQKFDLYNKGINHMANEKLSDAIKCFELSLRIDPQFVNAWIKKGYSHFHLGEYTVAVSAYDNALDLDINNFEAWNLKGLAYYRMNNLVKAIECCEKAIDINHNDGMSWYNLSCYLVLDGSIDDGMEALKRAIEIDISYAKRAVRDKDFENAKAEEGFRRIVEVVVLEAIRHGYDYAGKIVWITGMDKVEVDDALLRLTMRGLVIRREKKNLFNKEEYYELSKEIASKVGTVKRTGLMGKSREISPPVQQLKDISELLGKSRESIEQGDVETTIGYFDKLINPSIHGSTMIEKFFNEHRDLRLYQNRLRDKGQEYLNSHKPDFIKLINEIDSKVRGTHFSNNIVDN